MKQRTRLGEFEILGLLGVGGMGEVYGARDTKLGREVALKILPVTLSRDRDKRARFEREAHLLASLNHPNVATLYGLEESDGELFLVMELVEGETLAELLADGAMPLDAALALFQHVAEGLEAAHEKGIIHRDLKPSNIKITPESKPKILDFGLAKVMVGDPAVRSAALTRDDVTGRGVLLGTVPYMSPEQARGEAVDKRTDIWAFGCCLYEVLSGKTAFTGGTVSDTIAAVLKNEPEWEALPPTTPTSIRTLLHRCLQKDPSRRIHHIADARIEIEEALDDSNGSIAPVVEAPTLVRRAVPWIVAGVAVALAGIAVLAPWGRPPAETKGLSRTSINLPLDTHLLVSNPPSVALSPDGRRLVYYSRSEGSRSRLYLRELERNESTAIPGTEGGAGPFFSPDGESLGFRADGELKKVTLDGAGAVVICDAPYNRGADWSSDGTIVFATTGGLMTVPASGGTAEPLTTVDPNQGERRHYWPDVLPNGKSVIFSIVTSANYDDSSIVVQSLETGERKFLLNASYARYAPTGHVVYAREDTLYAVPFDLDRMEVRGTGIPLQSGVAVASGGPGAAEFTLSDTGTLIYVAPPPRESRVVLVDLEGTAEELAVPPLRYQRVRFSPDGRRLALAAVKPGARAEMYLYELGQERLSLLASELKDRSGSDFSLHNGFAWSPDGNYLAVNATSPRHGLDLFSLAVDGSGTAERLSEDVGFKLPDVWLPDGEQIVYTELFPPRTNGWRIAELSTVDGSSRTILDSQGNQVQPTLSPDGRWMAYTSNESGRYEIYITSYEQPAGRQQVSKDGGVAPVWSPNGAQLYYWNQRGVMTAAIQTHPEVFVGPPRLLFEFHDSPMYTFNSRANDLSPDGQTFAIIQRLEESRVNELNVVFNWFEELKRMVPTKN